MANIQNRNYSDFQNVNVKGDSSNSTPKGGVVRFVADGANASSPIVSSGAWDSTLSISTIGGATVGANTTTNEVPYLSIVNAGLNIGTGYIRYAPAGSANSGTISMNTTYLDSDRAWQFPNVSGVMGITGTFSVDLPATTASNYFQTIVTVTGIRVEDGLVVTPQNMSGGIATRLSSSAPLMIFEAVPGNGNITITFANPWATASIAQGGKVFSYTAVR